MKVYYVANTLIPQEESMKYQWQRARLKNLTKSCFASTFNKEIIVYTDMETAVDEAHGFIEAIPPVITDLSSRANKVSPKNENGNYKKAPPIFTLDIDKELDPEIKKHLICAEEVTAKVLEVSLNYRGTFREKNYYGVRGDSTQFEPKVFGKERALVKRIRRPAGSEPVECGGIRGLSDSDSEEDPVVLYAPGFDGRHLKGNVHNNAVATSSSASEKTVDALRFSASTSSSTKRPRLKELAKDKYLSEKTSSTTLTSKKDESKEKRVRLS